MRNVCTVVLASLFAVAGGCVAETDSDDIETSSLGLVGVDAPRELRIDVGSDSASTVATDSAGNAYVGGTINDLATSQFGVVKYDPQGSRVWTAFHSGSLGRASGQAKHIVVDQGGNVFAAGIVFVAIHPEAVANGILVKFSPTGTELWARALGPLAPADLAIDSAGNLVTGGTTSSVGDVITQKYSSTGALIWSRTFNGTRSMSSDGLRTLAVDRADNVTISGSVQMTGSINEAADVVTIKYDRSGNMLWTRVFGRTPETTEHPQDIAIDENGGVYITLATWPDTMIDLGDVAAPGLIKYDANGNQQFAFVGNDFNAGFGGHSVVADGHGRVYAMGFFPAHVSAFDLNGSRLWTTTLPDAVGLGLTPGGDIFVGGAVSSQLDRNGAVLGQYAFSSLLAADAEVDAFGNAYVTGTDYRVSGSLALQDIVTLKFSTARTANPPPPPPPPPVTIPAAPTSLTATAPSRTSVKLSWRDNANNEQGTRVERCTGSGCTRFARIADTFMDGTTYVDTTVRASTTYRYRVRAFNSAGSSAFSNLVTVRTPFR
jgi:hypothetical protein